MEYERVNGYPIVAQCHFPGGSGTRPGRSIIVDRGGSYVVAVQYRTGDVWDRAWHQGWYDIDNLTEALGLFCERTLRKG